MAPDPDEIDVCEHPSYDQYGCCVICGAYVPTDAQARKWAEIERRDFSKVDWKRYQEPEPNKDVAAILDELWHHCVRYHYYGMASEVFCFARDRGIKVGPPVPTNT